MQDLVHQWIEESPYKDLTVDPHKLDTILQALLTGNGTQGIAILAMKDDKPVGMVLGQVAEMLFSHETLAHELAWWVEPSHRGGKIAIKLLDAFEYWAKEVAKCKRVQMSMVETENADRVGKLYTRRGYTLREKAYLKELI